MCPRQIAKILDHKSYPIFSIHEIRKWSKTINRDRTKISKIAMMILPSIGIWFLMKISMIRMIWSKRVQWISWLFVKLFCWTIWKSSVIKIRWISIRWIHVIRASLLLMVSLMMMTTRGIMTSEKCEISLITASGYDGCHWIYQWRL